MTIRSDFACWALGLAFLALPAGCGSSDDSQPNPDAGAGGKAGGGGDSAQAGSGGRGGSAGSGAAGGQAGTAGRAGEAGSSGDAGAAGESGGSGAGHGGEGGRAGAAGEAGDGGDAGRAEEAGNGGQAGNGGEAGHGGGSGLVPIRYRFRNSIVNYDGPVYPCGYSGAQPNWLGPQPLWSSTFPDGVPRGVVTDYQALPEPPEGADTVFSVVVLAATSPGCPSDELAAMEDPRFLTTGVFFPRFVTTPTGARWGFMQVGGYVAGPAADSFDACGSEHDEPCNSDGSFSNWIEEDSRAPVSGLALVFVPRPATVEPLALCWESEAAPLAPVELSEPAGDYPPLTNGVVFAARLAGDATCDGERLATLTLPAPAPFGTDEAPGTVTTIGAGESGALMLSGMLGPVPPYAELSIVPLGFKSPRPD